ncbi:MAG: hypothetical protein P4L56_06360 [Candidatus Sulfopaludibacter sp.]|nr:hypothetical protein [Candidatus Sulfopaludibacter sp.]
MNVRAQFLSCAGIAVLALASCSQSLAQSDMPLRSRVTVTHVKPDMLTEWVDLQKNEVLPALKKAGEKTRTVYVTSIFGNAYEYLLISPIGNMSQFDGQSPIVKALDTPGAARLNEKLRKCTDSSTSYMITRLPEISNVLAGPTPNMIVTVRYRIAPGKMPDFQSLMKAEVLPVYKKAKVGLIVNARGPGANPNDVTLSTVYTKFADMEGGPFLTQQLGQEAATRLNAKFVGMRNLIEVVVRRKVADLSF